MSAPARHILLVEDSLTQALRLQHQLEEAGYRVSHALSAEAALALLDADLPDLLIADHHLPGVSGVHLCRQVRLHVAMVAIPILVLTADDSPQRQRECLDSGADDFLPKSADEELLLLRVRNLLQHARRAPGAAVLPRPSFHQPRILVVGAGEPLLAMLKEEGCLIDRAADGGEATRLAGEGRYDAAFISADLADGPGLPLCRALARLPAAPALMLVLAGDGGEAVHAALEAGVEDVVLLDRPLAPVQARLRAILRRRFLEQQNRRLLADFQQREMRALRLEAERNAAEARAAMADELRQANSLLADLNRQLAEQAAITRTITDSVASSLVMLDPGGRVTFLNPAARLLFGLDEGSAADTAQAILAESGIEVTDPVRDVPGTLRVGPGRQVPVTYSVATVQSAGDPPGTVLEIVDVTERKRAEEKQKLLMGELSHRVKNTLATVLSIGAQTRTHQRTLESFWPAFEGRVRALSETHNLLSANDWGAVRLADIVANEVRPYAGPGATASSGPDILVQPVAALALALVLHELATNAAKYGAFARPGGSVTVRWAEGDSGLDILWREQGGPPVAAPTGAGFGSLLIRQGITYQLGGSAELDFAPDGLRCRITLPADDELWRRAVQAAE